MTASSALALVLNAVWQGAIIALFATGAMRCLPRVAATVRLRIWWLALVLSIALPAFGTSRAHRASPVALEPAVVVPADPIVPQRSVASSVPRTVEVTTSEAVPTQGVRLYRWLGAALLLGVLLDLWRVARIKRRARYLPADTARVLSELCGALSVRRRVRFRASPDVTTPIFVGYLRPMVLLPATSWSEDTLRAVAAHELAHLERRDDFWILLQRLVRCALFFSPAAHYLCARIALEREIACDEWACRRTRMTPHAYAATLLRTAELAIGAPAPQLAGSLGGSGLALRIRHLLQGDVIVPTSRSYPRMLLAAAILAIGVLCVRAVPVFAVHVHELVVTSERESLLHTPASRTETGSYRGVAGARLHAAFDELEADGFRGAVVVAQHGALLLERGFGAADPRTGAPATAHTPFNAGALAKLLTAAAILELESDGVLRASDPLARWFGGDADDWNGITLHHLLTHTSGITRSRQPVYADRRSEFIAALRSAEREFEPGTRQRYTDVGYSALAAVIEIAAGMPYEQFVRTRLLEPIGMSTTWFENESPRGVPAVEYAVTLDRSSAVGARAYEWGRKGGMGVYSTAHDLMRWQHAVSSDFFPASVRDRMRSVGRLQRWRDVDSGYGWEARAGLYHALSGWPGNSVELMHDPRTGIMITLIIDNRVDWDEPRYEAIRDIALGIDTAAARATLRRMIANW